MLLIIIAKRITNTTKKKAPDVIKQELLDSMIQKEGNKQGLDEAVRNTKAAEETIRIIKWYEETLKSQNKKIIK